MKAFFDAFDDGVSITRVLRTASMSHRRQIVATIIPVRAPALDTIRQYVLKRSPDTEDGFISALYVLIALATDYPTMRVELEQMLVHLKDPDWIQSQLDELERCEPNYYSKLYSMMCTVLLTFQSDLDGALLVMVNPERRQDVWVGILITLALVHRAYQAE